MRVAVLTSTYEGTESVFKTVDEYQCSIAPFVPEAERHSYTVTDVVLHKPTAAQQIADLVDSGEFDAFVNLCDGAPDEARAGVEVVVALEQAGAVYTGADAAFYAIDKRAMKTAVRGAGVATPREAFVHSRADLAAALPNLTFPLIVKHHNGYGSIGMTPASRVTTVAELEVQVDLFVEQFGGAIVEEFVDGREFTVLVAENPDDPTLPIAYEPLECRFGNGHTFKHFALKWEDYGDIAWVALDASSAADRVLGEAMKDLSRRAFRACGGVSYGRVDLRVCARTLQPLFLEINPNCGLFYPRPQDFGSADHILHASPGGHWAFVQLILRSARARARDSPAL